MIVFDDNCSRAASIPVSHNHAGFPEGITGPDLLDRMRTQAANYGVEFCNRRVTALTKDAEAFIVSSERADDARARFVLLATGVTNNRPPMPSASHDEAVSRGLIRYCPVCDGFEITDKPVGIFGRGSKAFQEVLFLRSYTQDVTLIFPDADHGLEEKQLSRLAELDIPTVRGPLTSIDLHDAAIEVNTRTGTYSFASVYPALGSTIHSDLAVGMGADVTSEGCVVVDSHQRTSVTGLYAAGDVVLGLDQISNAMGQAGVAATAMRNDLYAIHALVR